MSSARLSPPAWFRWSARLRGVATSGGMLAIVFGLLIPLPGGSALGLAVGGFAAIIAGLALTMFPGAPRIPARSVAPPVTGRWLAANSPASMVPSHGTHGHGQTFAIDLIFEPEPGARPAFGAGDAFLPPVYFPGYGRPVLAPADGLVVAVRDSARDHLTRSTWSAYVYMTIEGALREVAGSRAVLGNYVILDLADGVYAALVHLQRKSAQVRPGDQVRTGDVLARCGNSGHASEPYLHFQLMDHRWPCIAAGLPFTFTGIGVPVNEQIMLV